MNHLKEDEINDFQNGCKEWLRKSQDKYMLENLSMLKADLVNIQDGLVKKWKIKLKLKF